MNSQAQKLLLTTETRHFCRDSVTKENILNKKEKYIVLSHILIEI